MTEPPIKPRIGDNAYIGAVMPDGTIYAGISPDTGCVMYATPSDAPLTMNFTDAAHYASTLDAHGHQDWRLPSKLELDVLFKNRAPIGRFHTTGPGSFCWYWSSSAFNESCVWHQHFGVGRQDFDFKGALSAVRLVR